VPARIGHHLTRLRRRLNQLIREQAPIGDFATAIVRVTGVAEIHCGFAAKSDADRLASLAMAHPPRPSLMGLLATPGDSQPAS
jgi:hypothetical protein